MKTNRPNSGKIAIVGMAGRFPGAKNVGELWGNLCAGKETIARLRDDQLEDFVTPGSVPEGYVRARGILEDVDQFDAELFGFLPREADVTDPQQRVLLECAWEALEDAGYDASRYRGRIGVLAGSSINTYLLLHLASSRQFIETFTSNYQTGSFQELVGNGHDFLATRISYKLNLRGPAFTVQSACSTSLLAVAQACDALRNGDAEMMLAGGVSISFPQYRGYLYQDGGMVSPDGHCRPFDADANGTVFGAGAGMVLLKRLEDATADGDHIYAVIAGAGVNNDGSGKMGYAAPSIEGQTAAIVQAHQAAGISAGEIGYVECHGTGTPLGDPIEVRALDVAFRKSTDRRQFCAIGSIKSAVGHLDVAAGVTGLIKTAMVLENQQIPPTLHFRKPNPNIDFAASAFQVAAENTPWPRGGTPRRAGVSAFGVGGTNVHLVLEEAPLPLAVSSPRPAQLLVLSAASAAAAEAMKDRLADALEQEQSGGDGEARFADAAFTLATGRREMPWRIAVSARDAAEAAAKLRAATPKQSTPAKKLTKAGTAFLFPGQGSQYPHMGVGLYRAEPVYRQAVDTCAELLTPMLGMDLREVLYPVCGSEQAEETLRSTRFSQPSIFVTSYALGRLWMEWGVRPAMLAGHSVGEFVAATLAGVFSLEDGLRAIAFRAALMQSLDAGAMTAVRMTEAELLPLLTPGLSLAAVNAPSSCVVSGPFDAVEALEQRLTAESKAFRRLRTSHAFHSQMMAPAVEPLTRLFSSMELRTPQLPIASSVTGEWLSAAEATSARYWATQCVEPVRFDRAMRTLLARQPAVLVEAGAGNTLAALARQAGATSVLASLPEQNSKLSDVATIQASVGALWAMGMPVDFPAYYGREQRSRIPLPTYAFQRTRHWVEVTGRERVAAQLQAASIPSVLPATVAQVSSPEPARPVTIVPEPTVPEKEKTVPETSTLMNSTFAAPSLPRKRAARYADELEALFEDLSGIRLEGGMRSESFLELGFDSLFLTQVSQQIQKNYGLKVTFRQMLEQYSSLEALAAHLDTSLPTTPEPAPVEASSAPAPATGQKVQEQTGEVGTSLVTMPAVPATPAAVIPAAAVSGGNLPGIESLMQQQLAAFADLMRQQLAVLSGQAAAPAVASVPAAAAGSTQAAVSAPAVAAAVAPASEALVPAAPASIGLAPAAASTSDALPEQPLRSSPVFSSTAVSAGAAKTTLNDEQRAYIDRLIERVCARTPKSKKYADQYRGVHADPRSASGFRPEWKEMVYSLVVDRSSGSQLWDIDGNQYVDLVNGFGATMFGHGPEFVTEALRQQGDLSLALGPQTPLAGVVAQLISEMTGNERVTFCNTGSEAVMAAMRVARTVTGRDKVVLFAGAYHGQFDEVLIKGVRRGNTPHTLPAAPGIPRANVQNMIVLEYGAPESLAWIAAHAQELAAVLVEPVQSRHPGLQPRDFLHEIRRITEASETALIFDEVVTGFRVHPGGAQALFGIRADLATYGKVAGGGTALGVLAGKAKFMDALDGGQWQFGDDSFPSVGMTFFAGTFVRHPLTMAATYATLKHIQASGPALYEAVNRRAERFENTLNDIFSRHGQPMKLERFGSVTYFSIPPELRYGGLLFYLLREKGIYALEGFPLYLTTEHTDRDLDHIFAAVEESIVELQKAGLLPASPDGTPGARAGVSPEAAPAEAEAVEIALTEPQMEILLAAQAGEEASCAFNECFSLTLEGPLDAGVLQASVDEVVSAHDALRMSLNAAGDRMRIHPRVRVALEPVDLSALAPDEQQAERQRLIVEEGRRAFDLEHGPLVRARLLRFAAGRHELVVTAHHIVCDGWSVNVILDELGRRYTSRIEQTPLALDPTISFREYAASLNSPEAGAHRLQAEQYWLSQFPAPPETIDLPTDRPRGPVRSFDGATYFGSLPPELLKTIRQAGAAQGSTLFATLLACWQVLLGRLSASQQVITMVPAAAQSQIEDATLVGHCVQLLPITTQLSPNLTVAELLKDVKHRVLDAYDHQDYTMGSLVHALKLPPVAGRLPISEVQFNLERVGASARFAGLKTSARANGKQYVNFDLFLNIVETDAGLRLECDYNTALYDASTIARWMGYYRHLLESLAGAGNAPVATLDLLDAAERERLLYTLNATEKLYPADASIPELISRQAELSPNSTAAEFYGRKLTRRELEQQSNQLCSLLLKNGIGTGQMVGIYIERSTEMLIAMLAVLKAGAAYVPLDPLYPKERVASILRDTEMSLMLTLERHLEALPAEIPTITLDRDAWRKEPATAPEPVAADALAYVIFTSGSTGKPKGVEVTHRSVVNLLLSAAERIEFSATDRLLAVTTLTFDIAALELLLPLVNGGTVVIAKRDDAADGARLAELLRAARITVLQATPITWRMLLDAGFASTPELKMLCGGESWSMDLGARLLAGGGRLWNMYGPTETTIWSSIQEVKAGNTAVTLGSPIANTQFYVLDARQQPVPPGVTGELYIGGDGLARGYYQQPDLTAQAFFPDPFRAGNRMYKTGDLVRQFVDGNIQYLRRADHQIKLRGFRIELGEIEQAILDSSSRIDQAVVALKLDRSQDPRLVAYIRSEAGEVDTEELRATLLGRLPEYMVPAYWMPVSHFPLTHNRKIDRKALPEPEWSKATRHHQYRAPETAEQQKLAAIWSEVLGIDQVGIEDSLLELGADSLKIFQIAARSNRAGLKVSAKQLMMLKTISAIVAELGKPGSDAPASSGPVVRVSRDKYRVAIPAAEPAKAGDTREVQTTQ